MAPPKDDASPSPPSAAKAALMRKLLEQRLKQGQKEARRSSGGAGPGGGADAIPRRSDDGPAPLSYAQQRLWFLDQFEPGNPAYNVPEPHRIRGPLDLGALEAALNHLVERHAALRTRFAVQHGSAVQVVAPHKPLTLPVEDLSALAPAEREAEAMHRAREEARRPVDLQRGPVARFRLLRLAEEDHVLLLSFHHSTMDGWSMALFLRELDASYQACKAGKTPQLPALPITYADYAAWQRKRLDGPELASQLAYWRRMLEHVPVLELPTDRRRPAVQTFHGASVHYTVPPELVARLKALAQAEGATLFQVVLAAFQVLLHRYARQDDFAVGAPIAGRDRPELEGLVGLFINTLVYRADLTGDPTFRTHLARLKGRAVDALQHAEVPFGKLVEELVGERELSHAPLFQVLFGLTSAVETRPRLGAARMQPLHVDSGTSKVDLTFALAETGDGGLEGSFEYNTDLFEEATVRRMAGHFTTLLHAVVQAPGARVSRLALMGSAERAEVLAAPNLDEQAFAVHDTLAERFAAQAGRTPDRVAVNLGAEARTYAELDAAANRLAHRLRGLGVGPDVPVALLLERGLDMVVAMLGVVKAGGAYVPVDPAYPEERIAYTFADCGAPVVVTQAALRDRVPAAPGRTAVVLDAPDEVQALVALPGDAPASGVRPEHLAYVIYTSGSTGKPKGCMVSQANALRLFDATDAWFGFGPEDVWTLFHSYAFDFSVWELWGALLYGGRLVVVPKDVARDTAAFHDLLRDEGVTVLNQTPSAFYQLLRVDEDRAHDPARPLRLRTVVFGGEALEPASLKPWFRKHGDGATVAAGGHPATEARPATGPRLINMYGITETTVHVTYRPITMADALAPGRSPIGRPIPDLRLHILDPTTLEPVPFGVPGELCVGGAGVARGYLGRPDLTPQRFIADPFAPPGRPGARLYRSGDLAKILPSGEVEYLGRIDFQVKVRGFRIELGEIEAAMARHPLVQEAVVLAREDADGHDDPPGTKRLVGYAVPRHEAALPVMRLAKLRREGRLKEREAYPLPNGMSVVGLNKAETEFLYREVFLDDSYLSHGIVLREGDVVFDVGANIGLFALQVAQRVGQVKLYGFEPIPPVYEALKANAELYGLDDAKLFAVGLSREAATARFQYYPKVSVISGMFGDAAADREMVKGYLLRQWEEDHGSTEGLDDAVLEQMLEEQLQVREVDAPLKTLSQVLREEGVQAIDLLKVDVEKAELDVLLGIEEQDWPRIRQVVGEVHDIDGRVAVVKELLERHGFQVTIDQDELLTRSDLYNFYAVRPDDPVRAAAASTPAASIDAPPAGASEAAPALRHAWSSPAVASQELRDFLATKLPEHMVPSGLVFLDALPLTPNGKVDRRALPAPEVSRAQLQKAYKAPEGEAEAALAAIWAEVLKVPQVGVEDNFFELGGDSILSIQVVSRAQKLGIRFTPKDLFQHQTITALARHAASQGAGAGAAAQAVVAEQGAVQGEVALTPIQRWFLDRDLHGQDRFNQSVLLQAPADLDADALAKAFGAVLAHHDALRLRFHRDASPGTAGWRQEHAPPPGPDDVPIEILDLRGPAGQGPDEAALQDALDRIQGSLSLSGGPVTRLAVLDLGAQGKRLLWVAHHLVVDGVSWRILVEDLQACYQACLRGEAPASALAAKTSSYRAWAERLTALAAGDALHGELAHWQAQAGIEVPPLPRDTDAGDEANTLASMELVSLRLDEATTAALLQEAPKAYRTQINDLLLAALAQACARWTGQPRLRVDLEGHGREEDLVGAVDLSRTVGWFTAIFPVTLTLPDASDPGACIKAVKEQLRAVPHKGAGFGVLRWMAPAEVQERLAAIPHPEVTLNYLGRFEPGTGTGTSTGTGAVADGDAPAAFQALPDARGREHTEAGTRTTLLDVNAQVAGGRLEVDFAFSKALHHEATVQALARGFESALRDLVAHCQAPGSGGLTPSDVPLAHTDQATLDALWNEAQAKGRQVEDVLPLAPMQEGMLYHTLLDPEARLYLEQAEVVLRGEVDVDAMRAAWQEVVARHAPLRTGFAWEGHAKPLQVVHRRVDVPLEVHDLAALPPEERDARRAALLQAHAAAGFDLAAPPLIRLALLREGAAAWRLLWSFDHALLDGWSLAVVLQEVLQAYEARVQGGQATLPRARGYRDFLAWLAQAGERDEDPEAFWRGQLGGFRAPTPLPLALPAPAHAEDAPRQPGKVPGALSEAATQRLQAFARQHRVTTSTVVQAAWGLLLARCTRERDVVFGATMAGRPADLDGVEGMVGAFLNTVPVRVEVPANAKVGAWVAHLQKQQVEARPFEHTPLVQVQAWSDVPPGSPLFDSLLVFENYPVGDLAEQQGKPLRLVEVTAQDRTNYPLTLVASTERALSFRLVYDPRRFRDEDVARMAGWLTTLLEAIPAMAEQPVTALPMLTDEEAAQVRRFGAPAVLPVTHTGPVHALVESQAAARPDAVAVQGADGSTLTYAELDARANRLAHHLRKAGAGARAPVALLLPRSPDLVVAMLAALKAGSPYLPIDPEYPAQRVAFMLRDTRAPVVLTTTALRGLVAHGLVAQVRCLDTPEVAEALAAEPAGKPDTRASPDDLAYLIFTSGSTGQPKGVMTPHKGLLNLVAWHNATYGVQPGDRAAPVAGLAFDATVWETWPYLCAGATLVLPDETTRMSPEALRDWLLAERITVTFAATPVAEAMLALPWPREGVALRALLTGGDRLTRLPKEPLPFRLVNHYGPSECSVVTSAGDVAVPGEPGQAPHIGKPIANLVVRILGPDLAPVPVGVPGELCVGGAGLADGYWERAALTAERFIADPVATDGAGTAGGAPRQGSGEGAPGGAPRQDSGEGAPGGALRQGIGEGAPGGAPRLYRTGDLAKWLPSGDIAFLGRIDFQVKLRGFRIELGEVEAALAALAEVAEAVVLAREDQPGHKRLVAYLVAARRGVKPAPDALRSHLEARLPPYMVPSAFVAMEALPLTPNGKIDRAALPAPEASDTAERPWVAPRTATEQALAEVWREVLDVARVGAHDHFLELGGHSLLATQVASRVRGLMGVALPLRAVFTHSTLAALAAEVDRLRGDGTTQASPASGAAAASLASEAPAADAGIPRLAAGAKAPLSFAQERMWVLDQLEPGNTAYTIPAHQRIRGPLHAAALGQALGAIAARHAVLRTTFTEDAATEAPVQVVHPAAPVRLEVTDLTGLAEAEREAAAHRLAEEEAHLPFDLRAGPVWRARLIALGREDHLLLLTFHHIAFDGWSAGRFAAELEAAYDAAVAGTVGDADAPGSPDADGVPALPVQYADYAAWQRARLQGEALEAQLAHWRDALRGLGTLELPTDRPRPAVQTFDGARIGFEVPAALAQRLAALAREEGATPFMALLAAWQALLHRYSGQDDIPVGTPVAGRERAELEPLLGFFVNTLVMRGDLSGQPGFRALLARVREAGLGAFSHQEVPFERIVEDLQPQRDLSRSPLFQVQFVLQGKGGDAPLRLGQAQARPHEVTRVASQFDLTLALAERDDGGYAASLEFNTALYDEATAQRMATHLQQLLHAIVAAPDAPVGTLALMDEAEHAQVVHGWNATAQACDLDRTLMDLFEAQVARTPDAPALRFEGTTRTYRDLDEAAGRLAAHLRELGVGPETMVGVCMERSVEMVEALYGILKAGGAYVPLDPGYPADRLAAMVEDAAPPVILTQQRLRGLLPPLPQETAVVALDAPDVAQTLHARPATRLPRGEVGPDHVAYVIFTSGSTGRPKGVAVPHRGIVNRLVWMQEALQLQPGEVVLQKTPFSFDVSVWEFFWPLQVGACLSVAKPGGHQDPDYLAATIQREGVTTLHFVPSMLQAFLEGEGAARCTGLKRVVCSGEALPWALQQRFFAALPDSQLHNLYGPTEASVDVSWWACSKDSDLGMVPIGRPVANTQLHVVDRHLQPCPVGVPGELLLGGVQLARGYVGRPDLTAERFVPDPFATAPDGKPLPGARLYRTGDLVKRLPDGAIAFLGRIDFQVKVRGFRIELGEIEATLLDHEAVKEAVVMAREDTPGDTRLVAYLVPATPGGTPSTSRLREHLLAKLPEYMVPAVFVPLEAMPLSPNGKADRKALPAPSSQRPDLAQAYVAPRDDAEAKVAAAWKAVLGVARVGALDDFFELGGSSLQGTRVMARLRREFGVHLPLRALFEARTVAALAETLKAAERVAASGAGAPSKPRIGRAKRDAFRVDRSQLRGGPGSGGGSPP